MSEAHHIVMEASILGGGSGEVSFKRSTAPDALIEVTIQEETSETHIVKPGIEITESFSNRATVRVRPAAFFAAVKLIRLEGEK